MDRGVRTTAHVRQEARPASPPEDDGSRRVPRSMQEQMNEKKPGGKQIRLTSLAACAG
jgi:hypothetical protein